MRLIDANKIYDAVERRYQVSSGIEHRCERDLLELICLSETIDAAPVKHGRWLNANSRPKTYERICTACGGGAYFCGIGCSYKYCPNCGAKMDGERI